MPSGLGAITATTAVVNVAMTGRVRRITTGTESARRSAEGGSGICHPREARPQHPPPEAAVAFERAALGDDPLSRSGERRRRGFVIARQAGDLELERVGQVSELDRRLLPRRPAHRD